MDQEPESDSLDVSHELDMVTLFSSSNHDAEMEAMARAWKPYCTVASWYLWRSMEPNANL